MTLKALEIYKRYSSPLGEGQMVLKGVSVSVAPGEIVGIVGLNGSGKTTLLKILSGMHSWTGGKVLLDNLAFTRPTFEETLPLRENISLVISGEQALEGALTVDQFLNEIWLKKGESFAQLKRKFFHLFRRMRMDMRFLTQPISSYSKGMKQKVHIIKALLESRDYMLMDEPFIGLDTDSVETLAREIALSSKKSNVGSIVTSHDLDLLSALVDKVYVLNAGFMSNPISIKSMTDSRLSARIFLRSSHFEEFFFKEKEVDLLSKCKWKLRDCAIDVTNVLLERINHMEVVICVFLQGHSLSRQQLYEKVSFVANELSSQENLTYLGTALGCSGDGIGKILQEGMSKQVIV